jgi:FkbM family methyltransferase
MGSLLRIKQKIKSLILNQFEPDEISHIGKFNVLASRGTIRNTPDHDYAWLYYLLGNSNIYFDIGCNKGFTALMGLVQKDIKMILVDPTHEALIRASRNIILNNLGANVNYYQAFVSDTVGGKIKFYSDDGGAASSMYPSHAQSAAKTGNDRIVNTVTLDYLSEFYNLIPDLVKIDVEGAELNVLQGAKELAKKEVTSFFVEMHALETRSMEKSGNLVNTWCSSVNYTPYYLTTHETLDSGSIIADRGKCHLLLLPNGVSYPSGLKGIRPNSKIL